MSLTAATLLMSGIFAIAGIVSLLASALNADWFFRSANVRMLTLGARRPLQRIIYAIFGLLMIATAIRLFLDSGV